MIAHRTANLYAPHRYRHLVGAVRIVSCADQVIEARANYLIVRTALDTVRYGTSEIYSAGEYQDRVVVENGTAKFAGKDRRCGYRPGRHAAGYPNLRKGQRRCS